MYKCFHTTLHLLSLHVNMTQEYKIGSGTKYEEMRRLFLREGGRSAMPDPFTNKKQFKKKKLNPIAMH